jgi:hypothetical protein
MFDRVAKLSIADSERFLETVAFWSQRRAKNRDLIFELGEGAQAPQQKPNCASLHWRLIKMKTRALPLTTKAKIPTVR